MRILPTIQDAETPLEVAQLEVLRKQVTKEGGEHTASLQSRFNYAWGLVRSETQSDQRHGVELLCDIYRESALRRRECLYYMAIGSFKLREYSQAKRYVDTLCAHEPTNVQALGLRSEIENAIRTESLKGVAITASAIAGIATLIAMLRRRR